MIVLIADQPGQSRNFTIYNGFSNTSSSVEAIWRHVANDGHTFLKALSPPAHLQYVEIASTGILTICELKLFSG